MSVNATSKRCAGQCPLTRSARTTMRARASPTDRRTTRSTQTMPAPPKNAHSSELGVGKNDGSAIKNTPHSEPNATETRTARLIRNSRSRSPEWASAVLNLSVLPPERESHDITKKTATTASRIPMEGILTTASYPHRPDLTRAAGCCVVDSGGCRYRFPNPRH